MKKYLLTIAALLGSFAVEASCLDSLAENRLTVAVTAGEKAYAGQH